MSTKFILYISVLSILTLSCNSASKIAEALKSMTIDHLKKNISVLASDDFQGRAPATPGEEKTISYLAEQFKRLGLNPGNGDSYFQEVPLLKITSNNDFSLEFIGNKSVISLKFPDEFIGYTPQPVEQIDIKNSDAVFVGYGIVAPGYNWNDYQGIEVKGKTVITLVNDPGFATGDTTLFTGKAMTYYGRWTYKYEEALRQGAKAVIVVHENEAAAYTWTTVKNSWTGPLFSLENNKYNGSALQFTGWMTTEAARKVFLSAGLNYDELATGASKRGFKAVNLNLKSNIQFTNKIEHVKSNNVAAVIPGSSRKDECIIYCSHWDHLGVKHDVKGDSILNGALDNATGVAALIEIAKAFKSLPEKPKRSVLFLATTCEEFGLLGSEYYTLNPLFPPKKTAGVINMDGLGIFGKTKDMTIIGSGYSQLEDYATAVLNRHGRVMCPDPMPEKGSYFRADHFSFSKKGVPSLYLKEGMDNVEHGKEWAFTMTKNWIAKNYHMVSDNYEPEKWDFTGMMDQINTYFEIGYDLSMTDNFPGWKPKSPFKAVSTEL